MKYKIRFTSRFKKDYKLAVKRGLDISKLRYVIEILSSGKKLQSSYKDHNLINDKKYDNVRECHIEPDWLLIYKIEKDILTLNLIRTGKHNDLFE